MAKLDLTYVEWYDHWAQGSWSKGDEEPEELTVCVSVGLLYKEDKKTITLASSICEDTNQVGNLQCIGKGLVKSRKVLMPKATFIKMVKKS